MQYSEKKSFQFSSHTQFHKSVSAYGTKFKIKICEILNLTLVYLISGTLGGGTEEKLADSRLIIGNLSE